MLELLFALPKLFWKFPMAWRGGVKFFFVELMLLLILIFIDLVLSRSYLVRDWSSSLWQLVLRIKRDIILIHQNSTIFNEWVFILKLPSFSISSLILLIIFSFNLIFSIIYIFSFNLSWRLGWSDLRLIALNSLWIWNNCLYLIWLHSGRRIIFCLSLWK